MTETSPRIRVLALTTRRRVDRALARQLVTDLQLGSDAQVELVTVHPPTVPLNLHRVDTVDPSLVPYRPVIPVSGEGLATWGGPRKATARGLRAARRVGLAVRRRARRPARRLDRGRALEIACATSPELLRRAAEADVVVALEGPAVRGAARLGRRTDRPAVVSGARNVRKVLELHGRELPPIPAMAQGDSDPDLAGITALPMPAPLAPEPHRILIAPANYAGQAQAWAESVRRHVPGAAAMNAQVGAHPKFPFRTDYDIHRDVFAASLAWRHQWRSFVRENFTHVIAEVNRPFLGSGTGDGQLDVAEMRRAGMRVALLSHGSDARIPSVHAAREPWHSYDALDPRALENFERAARRNTDIYNSFDGTVFVSTPGLLAFIPGGVWLPLVVDVDMWDCDEPPLQREVLRVAHIPSSTQKGSHMIDPILRSMHDRGSIEYVRVEGVPHEKMPELYGSADIVVEQFGIADYSAAACEAMAAGRVVVSRVADGVRERVRAETGRDLPIVEANPTTLEKVILELAHDREGARSIAAAGREFCREVHDGRRSASVLAAWLAETDAGAGEREHPA
jgi:hypothetical protein